MTETTLTLPMMLDRILQNQHTIMYVLGTLPINKIGNEDLDAARVKTREMLAERRAKL